MKSCATTIAACAATVAVLSLPSTSAMKTYLQKFPNGDKAFTSALGHVDEDTYALTAFGELFSGQDNAWTEKLCTSTFPGTDMSVGAAFGDPCCTWKAGGTPDFAIEPFSTTPKLTECAATATTTAPPAATTEAPAATTEAPAATTEAPASTTATPSSGSGSSSTTPAPITPAVTTASPSPTPSTAGNATVTPTMKPASKCRVKKDATKDDASASSSSASSDDA